jgi:antitoxin component YwqK of YwqJK toxin-antitoxin module
MKKLILIIIIASLFIACDSSDLQLKENYSPSGEMKMTHYENKDGYWEGVCKVYFETGELNQLKHYHNDQLNGLYFLYDESGVLRTKSRFKNNKEVDTSFFYRENGSIESYSIYNQNSEKIKDVFFTQNGRLKKEKTFFIGSGKINAFKSYSNEGKLIIEYGSSKYVSLKKTEEGIRFDIHGQRLENPDSIVVNIVKNFDFNYIDVSPEILRQKSYLKDQPLIFKINSSDYLDGKISLLIEVYGMLDGYTHSQPFHVQLYKDKEIPKDNLYPMYLK